MGLHSSRWTYCSFCHIIMHVFTGIHSALRGLLCPLVPPGGPQMAKLLTAVAVQKIKPQGQRIEMRDSGCRGLILVVQPSGHKSWAMRFRDRNGKLVRMTL